MDLTDCGLRPNDAQALAACFPANTKCTAVLLDSNRLGDVGFAAVLQVRCFLRARQQHTRTRCYFVTLFPRRLRIILE